MKGDRLPDGDHVARYVPRSRLRRDEDDKVLGINWQALQKRPTEDAISVGWLEYFGGTHSDNLKQVAVAFRRVLEVRKSSGFAVAQIGEIHRRCAEFGVRIRVVHDPVPGHDAHASIRQLPPDHAELLEVLAAEAFVEVVIAADLLTD